uniref:Uncharacterized protein n=1 Tax=Gossypium raimondii TaxID=29730 RepID=A0A0D2TPS8_GOSRA|nr:hypothetical protein B456_012G142400 [Gossypium raimondii]
MGMMENSAVFMAPLLLRNTVTSLLVYADKSILVLAEKYKVLEIFRYLVIASFLFFLRLFPSFSQFLKADDDYTFNSTQSSGYFVGYGGVGDTGIGRALSQLLWSVNDIPVSSSKYGIVRSLAERLIEENNKEDIEALREMNRTVLSAAFSRTLCLVEAAMVELGQGRVGHYGAGFGPVCYQLNRLLRAVGVGSGRVGVSRSGNSAEKLAAELLWLAEELAAFLFKQMKDMDSDETEEGSRQTKMKMLTSWLPLLCRGSNGTDMPVLSLSERAELEKILEDTVDMLQHKEQEQVLSLWLHHFTYCPSSDWPNLHASYARWCTTSRKLLLPPLKM